MATKNLVPVDAFSEPVIAEVDGTVMTEAVLVDSGLQRLVNQCTWLKNRLAEQSVREVDVSLVFDSSVFTDWSVANVLASPLGLTQGNATGHLQLQLHVAGLPKNCTIEEVHMVIDGAAHGGSYPPGTFPSIALYRQDPGAASAPTLLGTGTDAPASQAAYELPHAVSITGLTEVYAHDAALQYWLSILGEDGANAVTGLRIGRIYLVTAE